jgi:hypothetical protein
MIDPTDTIPWDDVCFIDSETRSRYVVGGDPRWADITETSADRYAENAWPIIITWAYGIDGPVQTWESRDVTRPPKLEELPAELLKWDGYFAAWNSRFDRLILDRYLKAGVEGWLDMMAHASYNNLPLGLDRAAKACNLEGKKQVGKALIKLFCSPGGPTPVDKPTEWAEFLNYADVDVEQMQAVAAGSFPVPYAIWEEFWVSETINDRGLPFDRRMAEGGRALADAYKERLGEVMSEITDGAITGPQQYARQRAWVWERVRENPLVAQAMIEAHRVVDGEDEYVLKMDRPAIVQMIAALLTLDERQGLTDEEFLVLQLLEEREYGASAAPAKFDKMLAMGTADGRLPGQYVFGGATQTGRYSSKGVQVHNMTRTPIGDLQTESGAAFFLQEAVSDA